MLKIQRVDNTSPTLRELHATTFPLDDEPEWLRGCWWLVFDGAKPIGFAGVQLSYQWRDAGYLVRAGVLPKYRGHGLQKRLLQVREQHARRSGWVWLVTSTYNNNASANSLIARGYRLYEPANPWGARGTLYWRKRL